AVLEQAERPEEAKELRMQVPIRSMSALTTARSILQHATLAMSGVEDRTHALCNLVVPFESEAPAPTDVEHWLAAIDAARTLDVPNLKGIVRSLVVVLARTARRCVQQTGRSVVT